MLSNRAATTAMLDGTGDDAAATIVDFRALAALFEAQSRDVAARDERAVASGPAEELRQAFHNGEFTLHYQPVLRLRDERMVGAEALLRWNHPREGLAPSAAFVPALEDSGLIVEIGAWVVREAARQIESWRLLYGRHIVDWLSVNLSARQLGDPDKLLATVRAVHDGDFAVHRLRLEASGAALRQSRATENALAELHALGIGFAIDDFGTGSLSLDHLTPGPVDMVKLDASLIAEIGTPSGDKLIEAVLELARARGAVTLAKGVETAAQHDFLRAAGCGFAQGYLFGEPMDGAQLGAYALTHSAAADRYRRGRAALPAKQNRGARYPAGSVS